MHRRRAAERIADADERAADPPLRGELWDPLAA
jgi:hypothetical protein